MGYRDRSNKIVTMLTTEAAIVSEWLVLPQDDSSMRVLMEPRSTLADVHQTTALAASPATTLRNRFEEIIDADLGNSVPLGHGQRTPFCRLQRSFRFSSTSVWVGFRHAVNILHCSRLAGNECSNR
jgi:hypothetical protein